MAGFTLVELSMVLVIIGLLVGGVLAGQALIRSAELRSVVTQKEATVAAVYTFKNKYNGLPGDLKDAQTFFGAAADCTAAQTTIATCNGNGNDFIDYGTPSGTMGTEIFLFWKHLANAGLVSGNFTGVTDGASSNSATTRNSPSGKIQNSLWHAIYFGNYSGSSSVWAYNYGNMFVLGGIRADTWPTARFITSADAYSVDKKFDDGLPGSGKLLIFFYQDCATKADGSALTGTDYNLGATAIYKLQGTGYQCSFVFPYVF